MNEHACHLLWLTWSGRLVHLYDGSRYCYFYSSKILWRMHPNYATQHPRVLQQRYLMVSWQLLKLATGPMHYSSSPCLHSSEEQRENIIFYVLIRTPETVQVQLSVKVFWWVGYYVKWAFCEKGILWNVFQWTVVLRNVTRWNGMLWTVGIPTSSQDKTLLIRT